MGDSALAIIEITREEKKNPFLVASIIKTALKEIKGKINPYKTNGKGKRLSAAADVEIVLEDGFFKVFFNNKDERRMMFVFFNCSCDHKDLCESSLILSLGTYDNGAGLIRHFAQAFKDYDGKVWFSASDYDEEDLKTI